MGRKSFLKGAAVLGIAGLMVQIMGAVFRIPLGNIIGDEGMGYYQTAYPIYIFLLVFSTNGAPAAISKMTSERIAIGRKDEAYRVFKLSFILMGIMGLIAFSIFFFGAEAIVKMLGNPKAYMSMVAIAPALLLVPIMAVFRGYFQGMQDMKPTAVSQLVEQSVRVAVGLGLAIYLLDRGVEFAAAGATVGTSIGPIAGVLILIGICIKNKDVISPGKRGAGSGADSNNVEKESSSEILKTLIWIAVPITVGVSIVPIMNVIDVALVMRSLQDAGFSQAEANALYGQMTGMAGPIINIPMALALSMALSIIPAVASATSTGDKVFLEQNVKLGMRTAMIIGIPCSLGLMALAKPIMVLLFPLQAKSAVSAAGCLFFLAIGTAFLCLAQTMAGVLQGIGRPGVAVWGLAAGCVVKIAATYFLCRVPALNVEGAAIAGTLGYFTVGIANYMSVSKLTGIKFDMNLSLLRPLIAGVVMFIAVLATYMTGIKFLENSHATLVSICVGGLVYAAMLIKIRAINEDELVMIPKGGSLLRVFKKLRLM